MLPRVALVLPLFLAACSPASTQPTDSAPQAAPATTVDTFVPPPLPSLRTPVAATVTRVHDGDSMDVMIGSEADEVRLLAINSPESDECLGDVARSAMVEAVAGKEVVLFGSERDQFGRRLAFVEVDGSPVGWLAVRRGLALALSVDHPRLAAYAEAEDDAFIDGIGMWAPNACGPYTGAIVGFAEVEWDPPGRDDDNLNDEFVRLESTDGPVAVGGWVLRDESTRWRYEFPDGFVLDGDVAVHTGCGDDSSDDLYWCATDPLWNNFGDTAIVLDPSGNVVARLTFGAKAER